MGNPVSEQHAMQVNNIAKTRLPCIPGMDGWKIHVPKGKQIPINIQSIEEERPQAYFCLCLFHFLGLPGLGLLGRRRADRPQSRDVLAGKKSVTQQRQQRYKVQMVTWDSCFIRQGGGRKKT
eukprot:1159090-Pelagomonas_calceolata.AAC.3